MVKGDLFRVEAEPLQGIGFGPILLVTGHRVAQGGKVGANLVPPACFEFQGKQGIAVPFFKQVPPGKGRYPVLSRRYPSARILSQGQVDNP